MLTSRILSRFFLPLILASAVLPAFGAAGDAVPAGSVPAPKITQQQQSMLMEMQDAFTKIAQTVEPTVVNIRSQHTASGIKVPDEIPIPLTPKSSPKGHASPTPGEPSEPDRVEGIGSGVIVRADGYILTNDHVVDGAQNGKVTVTLSDGREFDGKVYPDFRSDLAVVKIDPGSAVLPVATFGDSASVQPGQWAIAIGSPFDLQNTMTVGIISALGRRQSITGDTPGEERYYPDLIQTDAAINPGNSGGPLFNINGQVIGINVAIEGPVEGSSGVGFAIPSDIAQGIMQDLITKGKVIRGQLGVVPEDLTPALAQTYGQKQGAFLSDVLLSSPAGKAGLQAADIVTSYNGKPVTGELDLRQAIGDTPPGTKVQIDYVRDGKAATTTVTIGAASPVSADIIPSAPAPSSAAPTFGLNVRNLTAHDRVSLGLPPTTQGVVVVSAHPGSPADLAGLGAPDAIGKIVVQRVNQTPVTDQATFNQAVSGLRAGSLVTLIVLMSEDNALHQSAITVQL